MRGLDYLTLALMVGGLVFLFVAWMPGLTALAAPRRAGPGLARVRLAPAAIVRGRDRARRARERARRAVAGRERRGRVAVGFAERLDRRQHPGKPLRQGVGPACDRLGTARRAAAGGGAMGRDAIPSCEQTSPDADTLALTPPPPRVVPRAARDRRRLPGDHPGVGRSREHRESRRRVLPLRRSARAGGRASGSAGSPACCSHCRAPRASSRAPSAAGCCSRRSRASRRSRWARWS